jgi:hypothetical protein
MYRIRIMINEWFINKRKYRSILSKAHNLGPKLDDISSYMSSHMSPRVIGGFGGIYEPMMIGKVSIPRHLVNEYLSQSQDTLQLDLVLDDGHRMVQEISNSVSEPDMSSLLTAGNILEVLGKLSRVIEFQKKIFEVLDDKDIDPEMRKRYEVILSDQGQDKFNLAYLEDLESDVHYILSHEQYFGSRLSLVMNNEANTTYHVTYEKDDDSQIIDLNESRFFFLWYLCYIRIEDKGSGLLRGGGIPNEVYETFSSDLKSSLARAWNNFSIEKSTTAAAEQAKYKSNINSYIDNIIELNSDHYCVNRKLPRKSIRIPHL